MDTDAPGYLALFTTAPTRSPQSLFRWIGGVEVSAPSYARVRVDATAWDKIVNSDGIPAAFNNTTIAFPQAQEDWGAIVAIGYYDAPIGGDMIWAIPLKLDLRFGYQLIKERHTFMIEPGSVSL